MTADKEIDALKAEVKELQDKGRYIQARIESWERAPLPGDGTVSKESLRPLWAQIYAVLDVAFVPEKAEGELQAALDTWRGLTDNEREAFYAFCTSAPNLFVANLAVRLLKASR